MCAQVMDPALLSSSSTFFTKTIETLKLEKPQKIKSLINAKIAMKYAISRRWSVLALTYLRTGISKCHRIGVKIVLSLN